ncbi:hypothetical protein [Marivita sp.]|uniref:hypothetical protein n=1 Tax=Marivita sp. TaxID=2003365 RepID=UPI0025C2B5BE|nr:hypothetical protein [Marivita sp.]
MTIRTQPIAVKERTAAAMFDMTQTEFRELVSLGVLPPAKPIGGTKRWSVAELNAILSGAKRRPEDDEDFE